MKQVIILLAIITLSGCITFSTPEQAYADGNFGLSEKLLKKRVHNNNPESIGKMAKFYQKEDNPLKSKAKALAWHLKAAKKGYAPSLMYAYNNHPDESQRMFWLGMAVRWNITPANIEYNKLGLAPLYPDLYNAEIKKTQMRLKKEQEDRERRKKAKDVVKTVKTLKKLSKHF